MRKLKFYCWHWTRHGMYGKVSKLHINQYCSVIFRPEQWEMKNLQLREFKDVRTARRQGNNYCACTYKKSNGEVIALCLQKISKISSLLKLNCHYDAQVRRSTTGVTNG